MISIIICSRTQTISSVLQENIINSIGCAYELIVIDNSDNQYSIFEAYNLGIIRSQGELLVFVHDDVLFHTQNWGFVLENIFNNDSKIGLVGIAGAKVKTKMPSAWWETTEEQKVIHIIQHFKDKKREKEKWEIGFKSNTIVEVVTIDGVFIIMKNDYHIRYNNSMKGFHNYDLNISFEYKKYDYKIVVTNKILIEHFSIGTINKDWLKSTYDIHEKYNNILPLNTNEYVVSKNLEISNAKKFINQCLDFKQYKLAFLVWLKLFCLNPFLKYHLRFWFNFIMKIVR